MKIESVPGGTLRLLGRIDGQWHVMEVLHIPKTWSPPRWHGFKAPDEPIEGDLYVSVERKLYVRSDGEWVEVQ